MSRSEIVNVLAFSRRSLISSAKRSSSRCFFGTARLSSAESNTAWPTETPAALRGIEQRRQRLLPDRTARHVDDAAERDGIRRVHDVAQVREHVFDLGARVEADAADDAIGDAFGEEAFFEVRATARSCDRARGSRDRPSLRGRAP